MITYMFAYVICYLFVVLVLYRYSGMFVFVCYFFVLYLFLWLYYWGGALLVVSVFSTGSAVSTRASEPVVIVSLL